MASIYEQAQQFRANLIKRDTAAIEILVSQYQGVQDRLNRQLAELNSRIAEAQRNGQTVSRSWLNQQDRYHAFLRALEQEFNAYGRFVNGVVQARQFFEAGQGGSDASVLINGQFNRLPVGAIQNIVSAVRASSPLGKLLDSFGTVASKNVAATLRDAVALGWNPRKSARVVRDALGVPLHRALLISRTESNRAYRAAAVQNYQQSEFVTGWKWVAAKSKRTCLACLALDGTFFPKDKPFPAHPACIPAGAIIHSPRVDATMSRYYGGEVVELLTVSGQRLTVTPNHPILTPRGWIAAGLLNESDHVVSTRFPERVLATINPNEQEMPASIEQVVSSFAERSRMLSVSVPTAAEDFHGDGEGSQVQIVAMDGLLRNRFNAAGFKPFSQDQFIGRGSKLLSLASLSALNSSLDGVLTPAGGFVCRGCVGFMLFGRSSGHHQAIGSDTTADSYTGVDKSKADSVSSDAEFISQAFFGATRKVSRGDFSGGQFPFAAVNQRDTTLKQQSVNYLVANAEMPGKTAAGLAGLIEFDQIRKITKSSFCGHVYNLQTATGWYIANGIITHNCRCTMVPVVEDFPQPKRESAGDWFERQPDGVKREMMSDVAFDAYKAGKVTLRDFVGRADSRKWGTAYHELSLKRALAGEAEFPTYKPPRIKFTAQPITVNKPGSFATITEAEAWASRKFPHMEFDFTGADIRTMNPILKRFESLAGEYPEVVKQMKFISTYQKAGKGEGLFKDGAYAHAYITTGDGIGLNAKWFGNVDKLQAALKNDVDKGWHPLGTDSAEAVFTHEFGHLVDGWLRRQTHDSISKAVSGSGAGLISDTVLQWQDVNKATPKLSRYAMTKKEEAWAEGFAAMYHTPKKQWPQFVKNQAKLLKGLQELPRYKAGEWGFLGHLPSDARQVARQELVDALDKLGMEL